MKDRIRAVQDYAHLSQQDFAARLNISPASLSSIYTGRTNPTNNHVMAVHRAFPEINVNWLMFGEGEMLISATPNNGSEVSSDTPAETPHDGMVPASSAEQAGVVSSLFSHEQPFSAASQGGNISTPARRTGTNSVRGGGQVVTSAISIDKDERKIKEIRVFYSNGTYESFVPSSK